MTPRCQTPVRLQYRAVTSLILIATLALKAPAQDSHTKPRTVLLKRGQVLELSLVTPLNSGHAEVGEDVVLRLGRPLAAGGVTVLPADWVVRGRITDVDRAGKNCKSGRIHWELGRVTLTDGKKINVQIIQSYVAKPKGVVLDQVSLDTTDKRVSRVVGKAGKGLALAPVVILLSPFLILMFIGMSGEGGCDGAMGEESVIPPGTVFYAAISKNVKVTAW
jgi:hypothetical protein